MSVIFVIGVIAVCLLAFAGVVVVGYGRARHKEPEPPVQSVAPPREDEWVVDVEVIHAPAGNDWETAIQKQLDAIEERDPSCQLVAVTTIGTRMILFYKRRIG